MVGDDLFKRWTHYKKGGVYIVVCVAERESDGMDMIVYKKLDELKNYVRPKHEFLEKFLTA